MDELAELAELAGLTGFVEQYSMKLSSPSYGSWFQKTDCGSFIPSPHLIALAAQKTNKYIALLLLSPTTGMVGFGCLVVFVL